MKKIVVCLLACVSFSLMFSSCEKTETSFDESLLVGRWVSGTEHYVYTTTLGDDGSKRGYTWDTADDVTEAEAQWFSWSLDKAELTLIHDIEIKGVPKVYTITELTATSLKYKDSFDNEYSYTKDNS